MADKKHFSNSIVYTRDVPTRFFPRKVYKKIKIDTGEYMIHSMRLVTQKFQNKTNLKMNSNILVSYAHSSNSNISPVTTNIFSQFHNLKPININMIN